MIRDHLTRSVQMMDVTSNWFDWSVLAYFASRIVFTYARSFLPFASLHKYHPVTVLFCLDHYQWLFFVSRVNDVSFCQLFSLCHFILNSSSRASTSNVSNTSQMTTSDTANISSGFKTGLTWDLTPYEQQRKPHELLHDEELLISPKSLQSELTCPICLDLLRNTRTTKECLHRFCCDCIETALRSGNKECPTCRKKLISKRCLRRDQNIDSLIAKLFPIRPDHDDVLINNRSRMPRKTLRASVSSDDEQQPTSKDKKKSRISESSSSAGSTPTVNEIELQLKPLNHSNVFTTRKILTPLNATINHLSKFINTRMKIEQQNTSFHEEDFQWFMNINDHQPIENTLTLDKLLEQHWNHTSKPWSLFYRAISHWTIFLIFVQSECLLVCLFLELFFVNQHTCINLSDCLF